MRLASRLQQPCYFVAIILFILSLVLYLTTLAPSVVTLFDDSLEFQLVTYQLGIAHPTGYPLYTLLGKLFTLIPIGNVAYRVNLMSAMFGAATVALLYLLILPAAWPKPKASAGVEWAEALPPKSFKSRGWPTQLGAATGALLLAVGGVFWQQATIAEVYTLNAFFVVLLLLVAASAGNTPPRRHILWLAFLFGLSLTHHRTMILLGPALAIYLFVRYGARIFELKTILPAILLALLPLLLYLYLPWRGHVGSLDGTYQNSWAGFWQQVSASGYGAFIFDNPFSQERGGLFYWNLLVSQFYTMALGLIGLVYLFRLGRATMLVLTGTAFLTYLAFNLLYNVADIEVFFIPIFIIWAVWSGVGAAFLLNTAATLRYEAWHYPIVGLLIIIFLTIIGQLFRVTQPALSQAYSWKIHDYGIDILQLPFPAEEETAVVGILGEMTLLRYFQQTENRRTDIETVAADLEADRFAAIESLLAEGKSVYLTRELPGAARRWSLNAVGPLIRVDPTPVTDTPETYYAVEQTVTPEITFLGHIISRAPHTGQGPAPLRLTLFWQASGPVPTDLKVSARLHSPDGQVQAVVDAVPVHFAYPTSAWRPGEIISDVYDLALPDDAVEGPYTPVIIWYDPAQNAAEVGRIELGPVAVD